MSIFTPIIKPLIIRELKKLMKDFIQPILDLIKSLVQPQQGTKFLVTVAAIGGIVYLAMQGFVAGDAVVWAIAAIAILYYIADIFHKIKKQGNGK
jgi:hypothetical protein